MRSTAFTLPALAIALLSGMTLLLSGCGGGGGSSSDKVAAVTRESAAGFSSDALILASKRSTDIRISAAEARRIEDELKTIREQVPAVRDIHTVAEYDLYSLIATVKPGTPWISQWRNGVSTTGEEKINAVLAGASLTNVRSLGDSGAGGTHFILTFKDPIHIPALLQQLQKTSDSWESLSKNYTSGDGNLIGLQDKEGARLYAFSLGWGDCSAGCISRHIWQIMLNSDGSVAVKESGPSPNTATKPQAKPQ